MIRPLTTTDKGIYLKLANEFYHSDAVLHAVAEHCMTNSFEEMMRSDNYLLGYIRECDSQCAGYAMLSKTFSPEVGGTCIWIEEIYILKDFRGKGLGKEFFEFIFDKFDGVSKRFRLEAIRENVGAISLYNKLGFEELDYLQMVLDK
ncbi:MAG: GNAT family N-acetyltransferase [Oscillospiraceae bacterium]